MKATNKHLASMLTLLVIITSSCTLVESYEITTIHAPKMLVKFDTDPALPKLRDAHIWIFNNQSVFLSDTLLTATELRNPEGNMVIQRVPEGEYTMVCWNNIGNSQIPVLQKNISTINDLYIATPHDQEIDPLYHSTATATLRRGTPSYVISNAIPKYYQITLTITGLDKLTTPLNDPSIKIVGLPSSFDAHGQASNEHPIDITPTLTHNANNTLTAQFTCNRFEDGHNIQLIILDTKQTIQTITLQPSDFVKDPTYDVDIQAIIEFSGSSFFIQINNWVSDNYEIPSFGG